MLIGGDDISNDVINLGTWLVEIWQLSQRGAAGELEVEFKFQQHSCKLSFLFPPCRQSARKSLLTGKEVAKVNNIRQKIAPYVDMMWLYTWLDRNLLCDKI